MPQKRYKLAFERWPRQPPKANNSPNSDQQQISPCHSDHENQRCDHLSKILFNSLTHSSHYRNMTERKEKGISISKLGIEVLNHKRKVTTSCKILQLVWIQSVQQKQESHFHNQLYFCVQHNRRSNYNVNNISTDKRFAFLQQPCLETIATSFCD